MRPPPSILSAILAAHGGAGPLEALESPGRSARWCRASEPADLDLAALDAGLGPEDLALILVPGRPPTRALAHLRDGLFPLLHVGALWRAEDGSLTRTTLQGKERSLLAGEPLEGVVLVASRRTAVLAPKATAEKFDQNAKGWDGDPASPGYGHFRWMRRFVAEQSGKGSFQRILDFGSGAGWVGIEAWKKNKSASLSAFDPSPAMVEIARKNALAEGLTNFTGRVGFGEDPPFPAPGETGFDLVISSGVISFARDQEAWLDGLTRCVLPGGTLVIGDIHGGSRGFRHRRRTKALLPVRELSAADRALVRASLERRGFRFERWGGYQLTRPIPELMHLGEQRLGGLLARPLLLVNRAAAALDGALGSPLQNHFDSWVMRLRKSS